MDLDELGNFKDVMISTRYNIHPRMFLSYFNADLENAHISDFGAVRLEGANDGVRLMAKTTSSP